MSTNTATYAEHTFTTEDVHLIAFGLRRLFELARSTSASHPDQVGQAALRVTGLTAKRLHDLLSSRREVSGLDGMTWHPAQSDGMAGVLQVQQDTFGATLLPQLLAAAQQALVADMKAPGDDPESRRLQSDRFAAVSLLAEVLPHC